MFPLLVALLHSSFLLAPHGRREERSLLKRRVKPKMSEKARANSYIDSVHLFVRSAEVPANEEGNIRDHSSLLVHRHSGSTFFTRSSVAESDDRILAIRTLREDVGIKSFAEARLERMFAFCSSCDDAKGTHVVYEYHIQEDDQPAVLEESASFQLVLMTEMQTKVKDQDLALRLYLQRHEDLRVGRRLLHGYSGGDLDQYCLRPKPSVVFFDCDDCLYFDNWTVADRLTRKIDEWCINHGLPPGKAYELYKQYGTALRGLRAEGYLEDTEAAVDKFLEDVHDISVDTLLGPDPALRSMILRMDPSIPRYVFTASVRHHAERCLRALGIDDLFVDIIDCKRCDLETKHSLHSFRAAMRVANVKEPEKCLFLDDSTKNLQAAREVGWRSVLVGTVGRDCGKKAGSPHAELEIDRICELERVWLELFSRI